MNSEACCYRSGTKLQKTINNKGLLTKTLSYVFLFLIGIYRSVFTAHFGAGVCRFEPTCSAYANEAFLKLPFITAFKLTFIRVFKCRPGSAFGFDPVPVAGLEA